MRKLRKCASAQLNTGISKCPPEFGKMKGAIIVKSGLKLPADLTGDKLEELAHADTPNRIYGIVGFCEYAKEGGEPQTAADGYGPEQVTGYNARKDTYTLIKFYPELHAALTKNVNQECDVYFFDEDNRLYGMNDGTDTIAGFPMSSVYSNATPHPTSSAKATMTVTFSHIDAKAAIVNFDYTQLDFNPQKLTLGLTQVKLDKAGDGNAYKLFEVLGGNDITSIYGPLIANAGNNVISGATTALTYDAESDTLTIAASGGAEIRLKAPSLLYENDIKGIEQPA